MVLPCERLAEMENEAEVLPVGPSRHCVPYADSVRCFGGSGSWCGEFLLRYTRGLSTSRSLLFVDSHT